MKNFHFSVLMTMVILPLGCLSNPSDSLEDFERRISELRREFDRDTYAFEHSIDELEEEVHNGHLNDRLRIEGANSADNAQTKGSQQKSNKCCEIGTMLGSRGLRCQHFRFARAHRHMRLKLVNSTLEQLNVPITVDNRDTLYLPFRVCALRSANEIDKCCLYSQSSAGSHNNMDIGYDSPASRPAASDSYKHYRSGFDANKINSGQWHARRQHYPSDKKGKHPGRPSYHSYRSGHYKMRR